MYGPKPILELHKTKKFFEKLRIFGEENFLPALLGIVCNVVGLIVCLSMFADRSTEFSRITYSFGLLYSVILAVTPMLMAGLLAIILPIINKTTSFITRNDFVLLKLDGLCFDMFVGFLSTTWMFYAIVAMIYFSGVAVLFGLGLIVIVFVLVLTARWVYDINKKVSENRQ